MYGCTWLLNSGKQTHFTCSMVDYCFCVGMYSYLFNVFTVRLIHAQNFGKIHLRCIYSVGLGLALKNKRKWRSRKWVQQWYLCRERFGHTQLLNKLRNNEIDVCKNFLGRYHTHKLFAVCTKNIYWNQISQTFGIKSLRPSN